MALGCKEALSRAFDAVCEVGSKASGGERVVPIGGGVGVGDGMAAFVAVACEDLAACSVRVGAVHLDGRPDPMTGGNRAGIERAILALFEGVVTDDVYGVSAGVMQ